MKSGYQNKKRLMAGLMFGFMMVTGTYNAVVINSESTISSADFKFVKRLDEVYGVVKPGREFASAARWQKISSPKVIEVTNSRVGAFSAPVAVKLEAPAAVAETPAEVVAEAAIQEELSLNLTDVANPKLWKTGVKQGEFSGSLATRDGIIEELVVSLPNGKTVSVNFSGMTGNVFNYDTDGEPQTGMFYQVDQNMYKVNLTSGSLAETVLTFTTEKTVEQLAAQEQHEIQQQQNREEVALSAEAEQPVGNQPVAEEQQVNAENNQNQELQNTDPNLQNPEIQNAFLQDQLATEQALNQAPNMDANIGSFQPLIDPNADNQQAM